MILVTTPGDVRTRGHAGGLLTILLAHNPDKVAGSRAGGGHRSPDRRRRAAVGPQPDLVSDQDVSLRRPAHLTRNARGKRDRRPRRRAEQIPGGR